jgi:hypothetical protein
MFGMKSLMMMLSAFSVASADDTRLVGSQRDDNNCVTDGGYQWCEATQSCGQPWVKPCPTPNDMVPTDVPQHPVDPLVPVPVPQCAGVMCMLYCENGNMMDASGCPMCHCSPGTPLLGSTGPGSGYGHGPGHGPDSPGPGSSVPIQGPIQGPIQAPSCDIPYDDCGMNTVCPRVVEITHCGQGGLPGYTTYRLSLVIKDPRVNSLYIMYGSQEHAMYIPPAYQVKHLGANIGGVDSDYLQMNPRLKYDSWLSLGHVDGSQSLVRAVGLDFRQWGPSSPIKTHDGAIFSMDPSIPVVSGKEIVIAQLTMPNNVIDTMVINVEGNFKRDPASNNPPIIWAQDHIEFLLKTPDKVKSKGIKGIQEIPKGCVSWNDGCNTCEVKNGVLGGCTKMMCFRGGVPHCTSYASGH